MQVLKRLNRNGINVVIIYVSSMENFIMSKILDSIKVRKNFITQISSMYFHIFFIKYKIIE